MTISKAALIDKDNIVINLVQWTDDSHLPDDSGLTAVEVQENVRVDIGWVYNKTAKTFSDPNPPPPLPTADENKARANFLLEQTDWTSLPDVANNSKKPFLSNQTEFLTYRNNLRKIAVNPTSGNITWPTPPIANWTE